MNHAMPHLLFTAIIVAIFFCGTVNNSVAVCKWTDKNGTLHMTDDRSSAPKGTKCEEDNQTSSETSSELGVVDVGEDLSLCKRGWEATEAGDHATAIRLFNACIKTGKLSAKSLARTYRNIGIACRRNGDARKAIDSFNDSVSLQPTDVYNDYVNRGNAWSDLREYKNALRDYDLALQVKPDYNEAYYNRGIVFERQNQFEQAKKDFIKAYENGLRSELLYDRFVKYGLVNKR